MKMYLYIVWYTHRWEETDQYLFPKKLNKKELRAHFRKKQLMEKELVDYILEVGEWQELIVEKV